MFEHLADPDPPSPDPGARDAVAQRAGRLVRRQRTLRAVALAGAFVVLAGGTLGVVRRSAGPSSLDTVSSPAAGCCGTLGGTVRTDLGPIRGVVVRLLTLDALATPAPAAPPVMAEATTDAAGRFDFGSVPAGSYVVVYADPSAKYRPQWSGGADLPSEARPVAVVADRDNAADALLERSPVHGIAGRVTESVQGFPVTDVTVRLFVDGRLARETTTDATGSYALRGVPAGTYTLAFVDEAGTSRSAGTAFATTWFGGGASATPIPFDGRADLTADVALTRG